MTTALSLQQIVRDAFAESCPEFEEAGIAILCEDALDIDATAAAALAKVGLVGVVQTPQFAPAGPGDPDPGVVALESTVALCFYETAANRQRSDATTALTCAIHAARKCPSGFGFSGIRQEQTQEGVIRATVDLAVTFTLSDEESES